VIRAFRAAQGTRYVAAITGANELRREWYRTREFPCGHDYAHVSERWLGIPEMWSAANRKHHDAFEEGARTE
jgi:hypothetical protein